MKVPHNYHVYLVECSDKSYYIGVTNDIERRIDEHNAGINPSCFTYSRRPVLLKYSEHYFDINQAIAREKQLKGWSRAKKEALINGEMNELIKLSKSKTKNPMDEKKP